MKKIFLLLAAAVMAVGTAFAQDINKAIELANNGNEAFQMGEYDLAVDAFKQSLAIAEGLGADGAEHAGTCKTAICNIYLSAAKNLIKDGNYDGALAKLNETIATADGYGASDVVAEAKGLIPNVFMAQGNDALNAKNMAGAIAAYEKVLEADPTNGDAYIRLGMAYGATGKIEDAVAAYENAIANGEEKEAKKRLSTLFVRRALAAKKAQKWQEVLDNSLKSLSYLETANGYDFAGEAALKLGKNAEGIGYFEKYLEVAPTSKKANQIRYQIADAYIKAGNKAKAIEYCKMIATDPNFGEWANYQITELSK